MEGYIECGRAEGGREWAAGGNCLNAITGTRVVTRNVRNVFFLLVRFCYSLALLPPPLLTLSVAAAKYQERTRVRRSRCTV